jgi:solute:Na+ symporter, SSS family
LLHPIDYFVIGFYFVFLAGLGWYSRRAAANSSEYFRAGGRMPWWLVGVGIFMGGFSAVTFTGAAGLAFDHGLVVLTIYWLNAAGHFLSAGFFAHRFRQLRTITGMEAVRQRFGPVSEQIFTWLTLPAAVLIAAIWLYGLAVFLAPVFHVNVQLCIVVCGVAAIALSSLGGAWGEMSGNFMQGMLLLPITMFAAWLALTKVGGVQPLLERLPPAHFDLMARAAPGFGVLWLMAQTMERIFPPNSLPSGARFLSVRDGRDARRASVLAGVLFLIGSVIWFIPPLAARALDWDLAARFPALAKPGEAAYIAIAMELFPPGLLGLLVTVIIAASMDVGLNRASGIFVRNFYLPVLRPRADERELVRAGRATAVGLGTLIILIALKYSTWRDLGVMRIMFNFVAMVAIPSSISLFWCLFTRRSPDWVAGSTVLIGFAVSALLGVLPRQDWFTVWAAAHNFAPSLAWLKSHSYGTIALANTLVCSAWFWGAVRWGRPANAARQGEIDAMFERMRTPVADVENIGDRTDETPRRIAWLCQIYAGFLLVVCLLADENVSRLGLGFCACFLLGVSGALSWLTRRRAFPT